MNRRIMLNKDNSIINNYLTMEALEDGFQAKLTESCEYCIDESGDWISLSVDTYTPVINSGHTISFRANLTPDSTNGIGRFVTTAKFNLKGNCMSMLFGDNAPYETSLEGYYYAFKSLFYNCTWLVEVSDDFLPATTLFYNCYESMFADCESLTKAPKLPATTLVGSCYYGMFDDCESLTKAPALPATTLDQRCYMSMFNGCESLTKAPSILPATTLANSCYSSMFRGCTSLTTAPALPATKIDAYCYDSMFSSCTSLTTAPSILPATALTNGCYSSMFSYCTSLETAPELPATTLAVSCYEDMFYGCSNLNYIKMLATNKSASWCLYDWVCNVASNGTFVKNSAMKSLSTGKSGIPSGWTVVDA